jgi:hypothetical protein
MGPGLFDFAAFMVYIVNVVLAALEKIFFFEDLRLELRSSLTSYFPGPINSFSG